MENNQNVENNDIEEIQVEKKSHKLLNVFIFIALLIIGLVLYAKYVGTKGLMVKEYRVDSTILTSNFSGLKIVHFSDLLYKSTVDREDVNNIVNRINELKPDIVVFTGDLVNINTKINERDIELLKSSLSNIIAKIGKYAIYGDYDYSFDIYDEIMEESDFKILNNNFEEIYYKTDDVMYLVGLPSSIKENIKLEDAFEFYNEESRKYTILLVHDGKSIKFIDDSTYEVDLILGGHSLNGSVVLPFVGGIFNPDTSYKYHGEYYKKGITNIYISSGIGTNDYGYRFLNKPSFNFYRLKAQS